MVFCLVLIILLALLQVAGSSIKEAARDFVESKAYKEYSIKMIGTCEQRGIENPQLYPALFVEFMADHPRPYGFTVLEASDPYIALLQRGADIVLFIYSKRFFHTFVASNSRSAVETIFFQRNSISQCLSFC